MKSNVPRHVVRSRYEIVGQLATGGMAEILLARVVGPHGFQRPVVVKRILPHLTRDARFTEMFLDEARTVARIRHPNVVQVYELGEDDGDLFMVMEFLEGESLGSLLRRLFTNERGLPPSLAAHIIAEVCAGLHAAHELQSTDGKPLELVHRDVTPQNVFITYDGDTKLLDFGIVKAVDRSQLTEAGVVKGKFPYMSPEQCLGKPLDRRSDVFALGVLLFEATARRRLFKRPSDLLTMRAICDEPVPHPAELVDDYPAKLESIVLRALARKREDRFPTAAAMRQELLTVIHDLGEIGPRERLAQLMQELFAERQESKKVMVAAVRDGTRVEALPAPEVDESVDIPAATAFGSELRVSAAGRMSKRSWFAVSVAVVAIAGAGINGVPLMSDGAPAPANRSGSAPAESPVTISSLASEEAAAGETDAALPSTTGSASNRPRVGRVRPETKPKPKPKEPPAEDFPRFE